MDHEHTKFVLATGFEHFWRGYAQKERMWVISVEKTFLSWQVVVRENFLGVGIFNRDDAVSSFPMSMKISTNSMCKVWKMVSETSKSGFRKRLTWAKHISQAP